MRMISLCVLCKSIVNHEHALFTHIAQNGYENERFDFQARAAIAWSSRAHHFACQTIYWFVDMQTKPLGHLIFKPSTAVAWPSRVDNIAKQTISWYASIQTKPSGHAVAVARSSWFITFAKQTNCWYASNQMKPLGHAVAVARPSLFIIFANQTKCWFAGLQMKPLGKRNFYSLSCKWTDINRTWSPFTHHTRRACLFVLNVFVFVFTCVLYWPSQNKRLIGANINVAI